MTRASLLVAFVLPLLASAAPAEEPTIDEIVSRYVTARGGAERWAEIETLRMRGSYSSFSFRHDFSLIRRRGDLYRLDFTLLDAPAVRARDSDGVWALHKLLNPQPAHITEGPYPPQMERESLFEPLLFDHAAKGVEVESAGLGDVDGIATVNLEVTLPDGRQETWMLDAETYLEVAVDSEIFDFTQSGEALTQRMFFDDFREVDGIVLPHQIDIEANHRLESMTVREVEVNLEIAIESFKPPPPAPESEESD